MMTLHTFGAFLVFLKKSFRVFSECFCSQYKIFFTKARQPFYILKDISRVKLGFLNDILDYLINKQNGCTCKQISLLAHFSSNKDVPNSRTWQYQKLDPKRSNYENKVLFYCRYFQCHSENIILSDYSSLFAKFFTIIIVFFLLSVGYFVTSQRLHQVKFLITL